VRKNGRVTEPIDEFSFQAEQAADAGIDGPLPRGERLSLTLDDGRMMSALRYTPADASDDGPLVTFLHGAGLNAHTWDTTIMGLGLPALAIDLPGHGDSSWRQDFTYTAATLAPDVAIALETWTDRPQVLVGQSLGGLTGAAVAASRPELVRELVVIDITPGLDPNAGAAQIRAFFSGPTDWASRDEMVERALSFGLGGSQRAAARGVYFNSRIRPDGRAEWKHHFAHLANALADQPAAEAAAAHPRQDALSAVLSEQGWHDLAAVEAPITLIRGDRGYITEADAATFAERVPHATVETVSAGHNVQEDMPAELGARIAGLARKG
jgi:pimeloyl-ACP methyl ester carboxylesterase